MFEGATAEVAAFLSIASKAAALGLLVRLVIGFGYAPDATQLAALAPARQYMAMLIGTAGRGDLHVRQPGGLRPDEHEAAAGLLDDRARRLHDDARGRHGDADGRRRRRPPARPSRAVAFYVAVYLFMNLGAFAVVAFVRNATGSEEIDAYAGLIYRSPGVAVCFSIILFSLVGLPPLAGFAAKFVAFACVYDAGMLALLAVGLLNTVLSLFYYLRVVKVMVFDPAEDASGAMALATSAGLYCVDRDGAAGGLGYLVERAVRLGRGGLGGVVLKELRKWLRTTRSTSSTGSCGFCAEVCRFIWRAPGPRTLAARATWATGWA